MHPIQCKCGTVRGELTGSGIHNRVICYCTDCRAFAHFLGQATEALDPQGGTEILQVAQPRLRLLQGEEHLAALRLSDNGMLRWYASCCATPIGNTLANRKISFIGLIHTCLDRSRMDMDFGPQIALVNTDTALGTPKPKQRGLLGLSVRFIGIVFLTAITGRYRQSPLFTASGLPRVEAKVLNAQELAQLKQAELHSVSLAD